MLEGVLDELLDLRRCEPRGVHAAGRPGRGFGAPQDPVGPPQDGRRGGALLEALAHLGVGSVAVATPYDEAITLRLEEYLPFGLEAAVLYAT